MSFFKPGRTLLCIFSKLLW